MEKQPDIHRPSPSLGRHSLSLQAWPVPTSKTPTLHNQIVLGVLWLQESFSSPRVSVVSFYGPEKSKKAKLVLAACTDGISKGAHGLAFNSIIKREKKNIDRP